MKNNDIIKLKGQAKEYIQTLINIYIYKLANILNNKTGLKNWQNQA